MTNTTEMPVEIWAEPVESGKVRGQWTEGRWTDRDDHYTRTDTIPSKAEVARAMFNEAEERYETGNYLSMSDAIEATLREWENAESK